MTPASPVGDPEPADGVSGEDPNRRDATATEEVGALDEHPDGMTPSDTTGADESSLPPGA